MIDLHVADGAAEADRACAERIAAAIRAVVADRGRATLAPSGGHGPLAMFAVLATLDVPWPLVTVLQVDERVAPAGSPDRNATGLARALLDAVGAPGPVVRLMDVEPADAAGYDRLLGEVAPDGIDVVHLGLGDDGHTASWAPGDPVGAVTDRRVATTGVFNGFERVTLTVPAVNAAGLVVVHVTEPVKHVAVRRWLDGDPGVPAHHLRRRAVEVFTVAAVVTGSQP